MTVTTLSLVLLALALRVQADNGTYVDVTKTGQRASGTPVHTSWERSLSECAVRCQQHATCAAIEFEDATGHCRMFSSLATSPANATSPSAKYARAQISTSSVSSHANPVKHVLIPTTTFPNSTALTTVFSTTFVKKNAGTGLRVTYAGSFGSYGCSGCAVVFHFTYNGTACVSPITFDWAYYNSPAVDAHWPALKDGICDNLPAGTATVGLHTNMASTTYPVSVFNFAFEFDSHLVIEEVYYPQNAPSTSSVVGIVQSSMNVATSTTSGVIKSFTYTKLASDTELLVLFSGNIRMSSIGGCVRWYFLFNGQECSMPGQVGEMQTLQGVAGTNLLRGGIIGGVCSNLPAGLITIDFRTGACPASLGLAQSGSWTGDKSKENFVVEEVRLRMPLPSPDNPAFNVDLKHWTGGHNTSNGVIATLNYNKVSHNTALRFRFFGSLASVVQNGVGGSMWCFQIDGLACTNPAPACTALWSGFHTVHVRPYELMSVCQGVAAGTRAVSFVVKPLASGAGSAMTGWSSYAQNYLLVDEVFMV